LGIVTKWEIFYAFIDVILKIIVIKVEWRDFSLLLNGYLTRIWRKRSRPLKDEEHLSSRALSRNNVNVYKIS
jgi:hypothetical protein